jgi:flagellar basal body rod protein FlgG
LEPLGGGLSFAPTELDLSQGDMESTGGAADVAIHGDGFFALRGSDGLVLSRDGRFYVNREGRLARLTGGEEVLDQNQKSILLDPNVPVKIGANGIVSQRGIEMGRIGLFDVPQRTLLVKRGKGVFEYPNAAKQIRPGRGEIRNGMLERANVDPMSEMALMMETLRQLEANANMIRYQDQMLSRAVNDVGKIG